MAIRANKDRGRETITGMDTLVLAAATGNRSPGIGATAIVSFPAADLIEIGAGRFQFGIECQGLFEFGAGIRIIGLLCE